MNNANANAQTIARLSTKEYDRKIFTVEEISKKINGGHAAALKSCVEFGVDARVILSEWVHVQNELEELEATETNFRNVDEITKGIEEKKIYLTELLDSFSRNKVSVASSLNSQQKLAKRKAKALDTLEPLVAALKDLSQKLKQPDVRKAMTEDADVVTDGFLLNAMRDLQTQANF